MLNFAGSALTLAGSASTSTDAHAKARNTAMRTDSLFMKRPPFPLLGSTTLLRVVLYCDPLGTTPTDQISGKLFRRRLDVDVSLAVTTDGGAEPVAQHGQQGFGSFRAGLKGAAHRQLAQRLVTQLDLERGVSHELVDDITQRLILKIQTALAPG